MQRIAKFYKVSFEQFEKDFKNNCCYTPLNLTHEEIRQIYDDIKLPKRATSGSAGYDFFLPDKCIIGVGDNIVIPTGIRCRMDDGWVLKMYPRSGHGFKYGIHLANTVGIIDADYYNATNEGHIIIKMTNATNENKTVEVKELTGIAQAIFLPFGVTIDDEVNEIRVGGFGSTSK